MMSIPVRLSLLAMMILLPFAAQAQQPNAPGETEKLCKTVKNLAWAMTRLPSGQSVWRERIAALDPRALPRGGEPRFSSAEEWTR